MTFEIARFHPLNAPHLLESRTCLLNKWGVLLLAVYRNIKRKSAHEVL